MPFCNTSVTLRPVGPDDEAFLLDVYANSRLDELAPLGWDAAQQQAFLTMQFAAQQYHYQSQFPEGEHYIILSQDRPLGRLYVARRDQEIRILDLTLLPEHRNAGIGTALLTDLLAEAVHMGKPMRIYVEHFNRSLRLFERLGFAKIDDSGMHALLEWRPRP